LATRTKRLRAVTTTTDETERTELDSSYPQTFLECRDIRHPWQIVGYYHQGGEIVRTLTCPRCGTDRRDYWSPGGMRRRNVYSYADGYRIGDGGVSMFEVRQEVLHRVTVYENEDDMNASLFKPRRRAKKGA
jgi:hypothetical protein